MTVSVLTAVTDAVWESSLVTSLERKPASVKVVRRCVDLADLLATASLGTADAALLSADLRRLDRDALARLAGCGIAVVGLYTPGDDDAQRRLLQLGVAAVLPGDASVEDIETAVGAAQRAQTATASGWSHEADTRGRFSSESASAFPRQPPSGPGAVSSARDETQLAAVDIAGTADVAEVGDPSADEPLQEGKLVAVWGPTGAPGRSSVAVTLASELAAQGVTVLLADADVYGGVVSQLLGLLDEAPGIAAAARAANNGSLDVPALAALCPVVAPNLRVLTGISRPSRWPELRPAAVEEVWRQARRLVEVVIVDCAFNLEYDEELSYDTSAPRRNGVTLSTLGEAQELIAVGSADPVGVTRLVRALPEACDAAPDAQLHVVVNRVRKGTIGADPQRQLAEALRRYASVEIEAFIPEDPSAFDAAVSQGRSVTEVAPNSPAATAVRAFSRSFVDVPVRGTRRRRRSPGRAGRIVARGSRA